MRDSKDRYLAEIDLLANTPFLGGWVDQVALRAAVEAWPWGRAGDPGGWSVAGIHHVLGYADFIRQTEHRLAILPGPVGRETRHDW
jgi:hypothetical protein